jgi:hypothetical protein
MADAQDLQDVKTVLLRTNDDFRNLVSEHQALDERVRHLSGIPHLSDQQQVEEIALKKRKLVLKDRIESMLRALRQPAPEHISH